MNRCPSLRFRGAFLGLIVFLVAAVPVAAAPPSVGIAFHTVKLDGVRLSEDFTPVNFNSDYPTVVFDFATGLFHMWVHNDSGYGLTSFVHATSSDGINFVTRGTLSYNGGSPFPAFGAAAEPDFQFVRAVREGGDWKLLMWTPDEPGVGQFDYNVSVFNIGSNPNNLSVTLQGPVQPVPMGTSGLTTGPWGLIFGSLFTEYDPIGGIARFPYNDTSPPSVTAAPNATQDLLTPLGFVKCSKPPNPGEVYISNAARTLDQGGSTLGSFFALRDCTTFGRINKQIYYTESVNGGTTWSSPVGLFVDGNLVTVDGMLNQGNFSHPELTLSFTQRVLYFSTTAADGHLVVVTNAQARVKAPAVNQRGLVALTALLLIGGTVLVRRRALRRLSVNA